MRSLNRFFQISCAFLLTFSFLPAQNWHPAIPGKTQFFIQSPNDVGDSTIHGFRTTFSATQGLDSIFTFNKIARWIGQNETFYDCSGTLVVGGSNLLQFRFNAENIGGNGMIAKPNGEFWFFGPPADTFILKTQFPTGDKWLFNGLDSAWIQTRTTQSLYSALDSVLQIQTTNGKEFWLSENHGFVKWDYFYPLSAEDDLNIFYNSGTIWAIEETQFGHHYPRFFDIWDLQPNDQFRYKGQDCGPGACVDIEKYRRVNSVNPQSTTITFGLGGSTVQILPGPPSNDTIYYPLAGITYTANEYSFFELLPGEHDPFFVLDEVSLNAQWNNRIKIQRNRIEIEDTCAKISMYFERLWDENFGEGLGKTGYQISDVGQNEWENLVCYNKVSEIWNGPCDTLLNPVAIDIPMLSEAGFELFPQPANDRIFLRSQNGSLPNGELQILAANGAITSLPLQSGGQTLQINLQGYAAGIYFLRLITDEGRVLSGKFVLLPE